MSPRVLVRFPDDMRPDRSGTLAPAARSPFPPLWSVCFCVVSVLRAVLVDLRLSDEVRGDACGFRCAPGAGETLAE